MSVSRQDSSFLQSATLAILPAGEEEDEEEEGNIVPKWSVPQVTALGPGVVGAD